MLLLCCWKHPHDQGAEICVFVCRGGGFQNWTESTQQYNPFNLVHNRATFFNADAEQKSGCVMENELLEKPNSGQ